MKSRVVYTKEVDDPVSAAKKLAGDALAQPTPEQGSAGILFCYSDLELDELLAELAALLPFPVVGSTAVASMDSGGGFHDIAASLIILTADDCTFSTALSGPITPANAADEIASTYARARQGGTPGLIIAFPPYNLEIMLDLYPRVLHRAAPGVPLVGGLPSCGGVGDVARTIHGGGAYTDRLALLTVTGNIHPVFDVRSVTPGAIHRRRKVTASRDNVVQRVGDATFVEYLEEIGMPVKLMLGEGSSGVFISNPLLVECEKAGEQYRFARTLHAVDPVSGCGTAIGAVPQGSVISVCSLDRAQIAQAAAAGMESLCRQMESVQDYRFSTVLAFSCIARYMLMSPGSGAEADGILSWLPQTLNLCGFYGYGELGPLASGGGSINFAHNESLVLCAF